MLSDANEILLTNTHKRTWESAYTIVIIYLNTHLMALKFNCVRLPGLFLTELMSSFIAQNMLKTKDCMSDKKNEVGVTKLMSDKNGQAYLMPYVNKSMWVADFFSVHY